MLRLVIITTLLLFSLGIGSALSADRSAVSTSSTLYFDSSERSQVTNIDEALECQPAGGLGYAISSRLSIDLQCRLMVEEEDEKWRDDKDSLTHNLVVGLSYKF